MGKKIAGDLFANRNLGSTYKDLTKSISGHYLWRTCPHLGANRASGTQIATVSLSLFYNRVVF